ncbi:hypothetical protein ACIO8H_23850 [Streptomyces sp. NPDC087226]|uniref:hypothetical protein n=1 Tax=Streptomyces sp. NPDC087226 TaxID=3365771 RepID=UPI00380BA2AF
MLPGSVRDPVNSTITIIALAPSAGAGRIGVPDGVAGGVAAHALDREAADRLWEYAAGTVR